MDINEVAALFHIHEKASAHGTNLSHIRDWAYKQLTAENDALKDTPVEPQVYINQSTDVDEAPSASDEDTSDKTQSPQLTRRV
jgi:hypothetical protein